MSDTNTMPRDPLTLAAMLRPTQSDRRTLALVAVKTAQEALRAGDVAAARLFLDEAMTQLRSA